MKQQQQGAVQSNLDPELFFAPPARYRGAPFWSWNDRLDKARLLRQIEWLHAMGMGGFFMHPRTGLATEYLGQHFLDCVSACADKAASLQMLAWLYDEDRWPSGYAGGLITREPACRERYLLFTPRPYGVTPPELRLPLEWPVSRNERGRLLARYQVAVVDGFLTGYRRLQDDEPTPADGTVWYAYLEVQHPCAGWNNATLGDVLNPEVTRQFLQVTHERYADVVGKHFSGAVPGIFTDEPHFLCKQRLHRADDTNDICLPFTDDIPETYRRAYGDDLLDHLPEVLWDLPGHAPSLTRYRFHDHLCERLVGGFLDPIGAWCSEHGLLFTGHLVEESTLEAQTSMTGDIMRGYRNMHLPGIDVLFDGTELNTAKQCQSAVHQFGRAGMAAELYGATGWNFSFADFKAQGDWLATLGVTLRVHHLAWVSMEGEAKRDYPGSISYQQPWWHEFKLVEDHFARINTVMEHGRPLVRVGVIHPIESFWLCYGPEEQSQAACATRERQCKELTEWLLYGLLDFDFISESLLPDQCPVDAAMMAPLPVGQMAYDTILVPGLRTIRGSTLERLERFVAAGGKLIFVGEIPELVDCLPSNRAVRLAQQVTCIPFAEDELIAQLVTDRSFAYEIPHAQYPTRLLHQLRQEGDQQYLFVCNTDRQHGVDNVRFRFPGRWTLTYWDTLTGTAHALPVEQTGGGDTVFEWSFSPHGHLLISMLAENSRQANPAPGPEKVWQRSDESLPARVSVTLSEPNVLPLELARWCWNEEPWQPLEETLRIEDSLRRRLALPLRRSHCAQPWCDGEPAQALGRLTLEFTIACGCDIAASQLALEHPERWRFTLDGQPIPSVEGGWWVDEAICTLDFPALAAGQHLLRMETDFSKESALEWSYLLGDFAVTGTEINPQITAPVQELRWGDWTTQGLPFYVGNVTYHVPVDLPSSADVRIGIPSFANPVMRIAVDGQDAGAIAFAPFVCELDKLAAGRHKLAVTAFGTRNNAFGCLHHPDAANLLPTPNHWHTTGEQWSYARQVSPKGILQPPVLELLP